MGSILGALFIVVIVAIIILACNSKKRKSRDSVRRTSMNRGYEPEYEMKNWYGHGSRPGTAIIVEPRKKETRLGSTLSMGNRSIQPMVCSQFSALSSLYISGARTSVIRHRILHRSPSPLFFA